jgi:arginyl-tRNA synthetase
MPIASLSTQLAQLIETVLGAPALVRRSQHADLQANGVLAAATAAGANPRHLAADIADRLDAPAGKLAAATVAGPGFLNLTVADDALLGQVLARLEDPRLGVGEPEAGVTTVIDYSQPNIAKQMHVGHLRSTIIGDALVRLAEHLGGTVIRQNHIGDWGTQFGMLIQYQLEHDDRTEDIAGLGALYRKARAKFEADASFVERSRRRVVALQAGDPDTLARWRRIVAESTVYFNEIYTRLGVRLDDNDLAGESTYNADLPGIAADLENKGIATISDGALCVFVDSATASGRVVWTEERRERSDQSDEGRGRTQGPEARASGASATLIVRKSDGGFGYVATDLAALRHRVVDLRADRILYVVDARQALHFRMVFDTARRAGWLPETVAAVHIAFGTMLGSDGRPFRTRTGEVSRLADLLDAAVAHARALNPGRDDLAAVLGIGALKYADLSTNRIQDHVFDPDRMVSLVGNTSVYLQYAYARVRSILEKAGGGEVTATAEQMTAAERALVLHLDAFEEALDQAWSEYAPHRVCTYLYALAQAFTAFYDTSPVLRAEPGVRSRRVAVCGLVEATLRTGLDLLGIAAPYPL